MADFKKAGPPPAQARKSTQFDPHESGVPTQNSTAVEAPKLGAESVANFATGPGLGSGGIKAH